MQKSTVKHKWLIYIYISVQFIIGGKRLGCYPSEFVKAFQADLFVSLFLTPRQLKLCGSVPLLSRKLMSAWTILLSQGGLDRLLQFCQNAAVLRRALETPSPLPCWPQNTGFSLPCEPPSSTHLSGRKPSSTSECERGQELFQGPAQGWTVAELWLTDGLEPEQPPQLLS